MKVSPYLRLLLLIVFATWLMNVVRWLYLDVGHNMVFGIEVLATLTIGAIFGLVSTLIYRANRTWLFRKEFLVGFCVGFVPIFLLGMPSGILGGTWFRDPVGMLWHIELSTVAGLGVALGHLADRQFRSRASHAA